MRNKYSRLPSTSWYRRATAISALLIGALAFAGSDAVAQPLTLQYQQTVTRKIEGATAAFSLDPSRVGAAAHDGEVTLVGRGPGVTHVIVVIGNRSESLQVIVNEPPTVVLPGAPSAGSPALATLYDVRFTSDPGTLQGTLRSSRREGNRTTELSFGAAAPFQNAPAAPFSVPLAAYTVSTPSREITLFDRVVTNSPLTVSRSNVRGLHVREGPWQAHAGYNFFANFEHVLLPTNKEAVAGVGYRIALGPRSTLTPNFYSFAGGPERRLRGSIGTLLYEASPAKDARVLAELGVSRALSGALEVEIDRPNQRIWGKVRLVPPIVPSLTADQQSGRQMEGQWTHRGERLAMNATLSSRAYPQGPTDRQSSVAGIDLRYRVADAWTLTGGPTYSAFDTGARAELKIHSVTLPVGTQFTWRKFGAGLDYHFSKETNRDVAGHLLRGSVNGASRSFHFSAYAERRTQAPTASHILATVPWLQQMLDRLGLTATTPQDLAELLRVNAEISAYGYANDVTIHVTPVRLRAGGNAGWSGSGARRPELFVSTLINRDESIDGTLHGAVHTVSYSQRLGPATEIFSNWSLLCRDYRQVSSGCRPVLSVSLRQSLNTAPGVLLRQRLSSIEGTVFRDEQAVGQYQSGMEGLASVEIVLDGLRQTRTDSTGRFRFDGVPFGKHKVEVRLPLAQSFFFTTPSPAEVEAGATVDFGIGTLLSGIRADVRNDAGTPLAGVAVHIDGEGRHLRAQSSDDGAFVTRGLPAGTYNLTVEAASLPPGYALESLASKRVIVDSAALGQASFVLRPYRSVAGKVRIFDRNTGTYVPLAGTIVILRDAKQSSVTDAGGTYMFRDLPAGNYVVVATYRGQEYTAAVSVPPGPALLRDVDVAVAPGDSTQVLSESHAEPSRTAVTAIRGNTGSPAAPFAVQIAALRNANRARALVVELKRAGLPAYLIEPAVADPTPTYRVRIGGYASREEATAVAGTLEKARGEKLWVTTER